MVSKNIEFGSDKKAKASKQEECQLSTNTYINYEALSDEELIYRFIIEKKNKGQFLPYEYHSLIRRWVKESYCVDDLLLILDEIFTEKKNKNIGLVTLNKKVLDKIKTLSKR